MQGSDYAIMFQTTRLLKKLAADTSDSNATILQQLIDNKQADNVIDNIAQICQTLTEGLQNITLDNNKAINDELQNLGFLEQRNGTTGYNTSLRKRCLNCTTKAIKISSDIMSEKLKQYIDTFLECNRRIQEKSNILFKWFNNKLPEVSTVKALLRNNNYQNNQLFDLINLQEDIDNDEKVSKYQYGSDIYYIYCKHAYNKSLPEQRLIMILAKNNRILNQYICNPDEFTKYFSELELQIITYIGNKDKAELYHRTFYSDNNPFKISDNKTIQLDDTITSYTWNTKADNSSDSITHSNSRSPINFEVQMYYSYFEELQKLLGICIRAKEKNTNLLKSFKLTQLQSNQTAKNRSRLRQKIIYAFIRKEAATTSQLHDTFYKLFHEDSDYRIANSPFTIVAGYFKPKLEGLAPKEVELKSKSSNNCVGILCKTQNELIAIPSSALSALNSLKTEYKRIDDDLERMHPLKALPLHIKQFVMHKLQIITNDASDIFQKVKNLFNSQEINDLSRYNQDILSVVLTNRFFKLLNSTSNIADRALLALISKGSSGVKIFKHSEASQADTYLRRMCNSQYTVLYDTSFKDYIQYNASTMEHIESTPKNKHPKETLLAVKIKAYPGAPSKNEFNAEFSRWFQDHKAHVLNADEVQDKLNQLLRG